MKIVSSCFLATIAVAFCGMASGEIPAGAQVDAVFAQWDKSNSPGCAVSVFQNGAIVYTRGYGMADLDHGIANRPNTVFHVASVSKQFASAAIVLLAQEGRLSLDDPARKYLPELPEVSARVTLRQLANHTSGLRDALELLIISGWRYPIDLITESDVLNMLAHQRALNFEPGEKFSYSNTGHTLLALVVKRVSGKSLREFMAERIFRPLGMDDTHFRDDHAEIVPNLAYGYLREGDTFRQSVQSLDIVGAAGLLTTVEDLAKWDANFYQGRVGGPALLAQMVERGVLNDGRQTEYALGVRIGSYRGLPTVWHAGTLEGYRAYLIRFPEQRLGIACLCNNAEVSPVAASRKIADIYLANYLHPLPQQQAVTVPESQSSRLAGMYLRQDGRAARSIVVEGSQLQIIDADGNYATGLEPVGGNRFRLSDRDDYVEFSGTPLQLTLISDWDVPQLFDRTPVYEPNAQQLAQYVGTYVSDEIELPYHITMQKGGLVLTSMKTVEPLSVTPFTRDYLSVKDFGALGFTRNRQGRVSGFLLNSTRLVDLRFSKRR